MIVERERTALIKRIHLGLEKPKKKRVYIPRIRKPKAPSEPRIVLSKEERLLRRNASQRLRVAEWKEKELCLKCGSYPVHIVYQYASHTLYEKKTVHCVKHSKQMGLHKP